MFPFPVKLYLVLGTLLALGGDFWLDFLCGGQCGYCYRCGLFEHSMTVWLNLFTEKYNKQLITKKINSVPHFRCTYGSATPPLNSSRAGQNVHRMWGNEFLREKSHTILLRKQTNHKSKSGQSSCQLFSCRKLRTWWVYKRLILGCWLRFIRSEALNPYQKSTTD